MADLTVLKLARIYDVVRHSNILRNARVGSLYSSRICNMSGLDRFTQSGVNKFEMTVRTPARNVWRGSLCLSVTVTIT